MREPGDLRIWLLGGFRAVLDGNDLPTDAWRRNRARALVKLLAITPGHRLHREQVIDALWPDLGPGSGSGNLRKAVHYARQAVGVERVVSRDELVALDERRLWIDVDAFEVAIQAAEPATATALYRGDLLPEDRYESWAEERRERLRVRHLSALLGVAKDRASAGDHPGSADALRRLLEQDPLHEEAVRALMSLHAEMGARPAALRVYRDFESRLAQELAVEPADETRRLVARIAGGSSDDARSGPLRDAHDQPVPGVADAAPIAIEERKLVTVVAAVPAHLASDPDDARHELDTWVRAATDILRSWGATVLPEHAGGVTAVFGVPSVREDDVSRAVRAAFELAERPELSAGVGVETGDALVRTEAASAPPVTVGQVTVDAGVLGAAAPPGTVLVGDRTARAVIDSVRLGPETPIGGRPRQMRARRVLSGLVADVPAGDDQPMVGRAAELSAVGASFDRAIETGRPHLVLVVGDPGVGKSRFVRELSRWAAGRAEVRILRGRCLPGGHGSPYGALGDLLRDASGVSLGDRAAVAARRLRSHLRQTFARLDHADAEPAIAVLSTAVGMAPTNDPLGSVPPEDLAARLTLAWPQYVSAAAARAPTLIVIEDLHWAAPELVELVELIPSRSTGPVLVLATARPEPEGPTRTAGGVGASVISLRPLSDSESGRLVDGLVGEAIPREVRAALLARGEGNPFFLEQLVLHVRDGGSESLLDTLPDTLHSLLGARLDSLAIPERRILREAAVVGRVFWQEPIARATDDARIAARLGSLERRGFIARRPRSALPGQAEYAFRHALLHDVAYASMPRARRGAAHAAIGIWLEHIAGDRVDEVLDQLSDHFTTAAQRPASLDAGAEALRGKALEYSLRAGAVARRRFVMERALELDRRALDLATRPGERAAALEAIADDHATSYHGDDAVALYRDALELRRARGDHGDRARLARKIAWIMAWNPGAFRTSPDPAEAERLIEEGLASGPDRPERGWLLLARGTCARLYRGSEPFGQGEQPDPRPIADRVADIEQARAIGEATGREDLRAASVQALGLVYGLAGRYHDMLDLARSEVATLRPEHSRLDHSDAIRKLATHLINVAADFEPALELAHRSRALAGDGGPHQVMHTTWPILAALFHLGRWGEALDVVADHVAAFREDPAIGCQFVRDGPIIGAVVLALTNHAEEGRAMAAVVGDPLDDLPSASAWQARYATASGAPATARLISRDKAFEGRTYGPQHVFALLEAVAAEGDWEAAIELLPHARSTAVGNAQLEPLADRVEGLGCLANGDRTRAAMLLVRSAEGFRRLKSPFEEARTLEGLADAAEDAASGEALEAAQGLYRRLGVVALPARSRAEDNDRSRAHSD
jgi:DNA-binding SARP family transcriptional activator